MIGLRLAVRKSPNKKGRGEQSSRQHFVDDEEDSLSAEFVMKNMAMSTKWAVTNFEDWRKCCDDHFANEIEKQAPEDYHHRQLPPECSMSQGWFLYGTN